MKEIWIPVKDYEGLYEVSNLGNVRSLGNGNSNNSEYHKIRVLKPYVCTNGYLGVVLCKNKQKKKHLVHRLVAEAFIPNWFDDQEVNHIDEDKINNRVENLEWCDHKFNCNYGTRNKRVAEQQSKPVLQYTKNGEFVKEWSSIMEADRNGFNCSNIIRCCKGKQKQYIGFIWKYKNSEKKSA